MALSSNPFVFSGVIAAGCMLAIDTDAHSTEGLIEIDLGLTVARRVWVTAKHVINCMTYKELIAFIKRKRNVL